MCQLMLSRGVTPLLCELMFPRGRPSFLLCQLMLSRGGPPLLSSSVDSYKEWDPFTELMFPWGGLVFTMSIDAFKGRAPFTE